MSNSPKVALLAPVPLEHLESGKNTCASEGKVAFGSMAWEVFRRLDVLRENQRVQVLIYASYDKPIVPFRVSWQAFYTGHCESIDGKHPDGMKYRPASTSTDTDDWAVFWEVEKLQIIEGHHPLISSLSGFGNTRHYQKTFRPEGPILINPYLF